MSWKWAAKHICAKGFDYASTVLYFFFFFTLIVDGTLMGTYVKMTSPYLYSTIDSYTTISRLRCSDKCTSNEDCRTFIYHELHTTCILYEPYSGKDMHMCDGTTDCYIKQ